MSVEFGGWEIFLAMDLHITRYPRWHQAVDGDLWSGIPLLNWVEVELVDRVSSHDGIAYYE
jgi:hypothetical protein